MSGGSLYSRLHEDAEEILSNAKLQWKIATDIARGTLPRVE